MGTTLPRRIDHLGDIGAKLRDLQGYKTLARELIQNADDAKATVMVFNVCDKRLIVDNNAEFSDCGRVEDEECPWKDDPDKGHRCDFHRFQYISGGDKRGEEGTTGAFGIGFLAVYQITDSPELISGGRHWILRENKPENERIDVCEDGCCECKKSDLPGTRFIFPWAFDPESELRKRLRADAVPQDGPRKLLCELLSFLPSVMLFLKHLHCIEVRRNGDLRCKVEIDRSDEMIMISIIYNNKKDEQIWCLIKSNFNEKAEELRLEFSQIEQKRLPEITIAISETPIPDGLLYAYLPTDHKTKLPFHINADFFPSSDRKRIIFDGDGYQTKWNKAAISASARLLANNLDLLPKLLDAEDVWKFLKQIKDVFDNDQNFFGEFWENIKSKLKQTKIVFTTTEQWCVGEETVFLNKKEEEDAISVLEKMGFKIVHKSLRGYRKLLTEFAGVPLLDIPRMCQLFEKAGMVNERIASDSCPCFFNNERSRILIWREISFLLEHSKNSPEDINQLQKISFGPGRDGGFWPCKQLFRADEQTIFLFTAINKNIPFLEDNSDFALLAEKLCPRFSLSNAIQCIDQSVQEGNFKALYKKGEIDLGDVFDWFKNRNLLDDECLKSKFCKLPIFPDNDGRLYKLSELSIPGNFNDPLGIAKLLASEHLQKNRDFFVKLGVKKLDFRVYVKDHLIGALNLNLSPDKQRDIIRLLVEKFGEIYKDEELRQIITELPIVECMDNKFHRPFVCYFDKPDVRECLGANVFLVKLSEERTKQFEEFYRWVGVEEKPRYKDIVKYIRQIVKQPYSSENAKLIKKIMEHLNQRLTENESGELDKSLEDLEYMEWLPAQGKARWYKPSDLYAPYQKYLFESQATFLDIPQQFSQKPLLQYLKIKSKPEITLVVKHLLYCSENNFQVNEGIYRFLNDNASKEELKLLKDKKCLYFDNQYWHPNRVFWDEHPFGKYRRRLDEGLREFNNFFKNVGVKEKPDYQDAIEVLKEIGEEFGSINKVIDDKIENIVMECWKMLEKFLDSDLDPKSLQQQLKNVKCVPDKRKLLRSPNEMFFENRTDLAKKFRKYIPNELIPQPVGATNVMLAAGVRRLSDVVSIELLHVEDYEEGVELRERIFERLKQFARVLGNPKNIDLLLHRLKQIQYIKVSSLLVRYILSLFSFTQKIPPESVQALYHIKTGQLLFVCRENRIPWTSIARELAIALFPDDEPGQWAISFDQVLSPPSKEEVETKLDQLNFPEIEMPVESQQSDDEEKVKKLGEDTSFSPEKECFTEHIACDYENEEKNAIKKKMEIESGTLNRNISKQQHNIQKQKFSFAISSKSQFQEDRSITGLSAFSSTHSRTSMSERRQQGKVAECLIRQELRKYLSENWNISEGSKRDEAGRETDILLKHPEYCEVHIEVKNVESGIIFWSEKEIDKAKKHKERYIMAIVMNNDIFWILKPLEQLKELKRTGTWLWRSREDMVTLSSRDWERPQEEPVRKPNNFSFRIEEITLEFLKQCSLRIEELIKVIES
jgi:hypothetical protein